MSCSTVIAFDCFGTVFDMSVVSQEEIRGYVRHVKRNDFSPFRFPDSWHNLKCHIDAAEGIAILQQAGYVCVTLSNGPVNLLRTVSERAGIAWDKYIDLAAHRVYKPHRGAYLTVEYETGVRPERTIMVTANPSFGDVESATAIGMIACVIRQQSGKPDMVDFATAISGAQVK